MIELLGQLRECVTALSESRRRQEAEFEQALEALQTAVIETKLYAAHLDRYCRPTPNDGLGFARNELMRVQPDLSRKPRSIAEEKRIARLWTAAARKLRNFDQDLAARCHIKSDYWTEPSDWTDQDLSEFQIELDGISQELYELLLGTRKHRGYRMFRKRHGQLEGETNQPQLPGNHTPDSTGS